MDGAINHKSGYQAICGCQQSLLHLHFKDHAWTLLESWWHSRRDIHPIQPMGRQKMLKVDMSWLTLHSKSRYSVPARNVVVGKKISYVCLENPHSGRSTLSWWPQHQLHLKIVTCCPPSLYLSQPGFCRTLGFFQMLLGAPCAMSSLCL